MTCHRHHNRMHRRSGAALVETAVALPVFFMFMFAIFEFGYAYMVVNSLNSAARKAARYGVAEGITTDDVTGRAMQLVGASIPTAQVTVMVKDASIFDEPGVDATGIDYAALPSIDLSEAEARQLFVVRVEVPYEDVAILPPFWITGATLKGQSVMRHE